jgi:hypothetical protein
MIPSKVNSEPYIIEDILDYLSNDNHPDVRFAMAENTSMPKHVLRNLASDDNPYIASRAASTLERLEQEQEVDKKDSLCAVSLTQTEPKLQAYASKQREGASW